MKRHWFELTYSSRACEARPAEPRGRITDRRISVGWTRGGGGLCAVQVQMHKLGSVSIRGFRC